MAQVDTGGAKTAGPRRPLKRIKAKPKPKAVTLVPGVGAVARPTPAMHTAARTVARAKLAPKPTARKPAPKPAPPRNADTGDPARGRPPKRAPIFTRKPVAGMLAAERGAVEALSALHSQNPDAYKKRLQSAGLEDRVKAGPRGQTVEHYKGRDIGESVQRWATPAPKKKRIVVAGARGQTKPTHEMATPGGKVAEAAARNFLPNVDDLITGMPTSLAHIGVQAYKADKALVKGLVKGRGKEAKEAGKENLKLGKMLAQPYIDVAKDPLKELAERPVSTTLTVAPVGRVPGLAAGRIARKTGKFPGLKKQTAERTPAVMPGTAMTERVAGSRSYGKRQREAKEDAGGPRTMTQQELDRRLDDFREYGVQHVHQARDTAASQAKARGMNEEEAATYIETRTQQAEDVVSRQFAEEFGANARPFVGKADKEASGAAREAAHTAKEDATAAADAAHADVQSALGEARAARGSGSPHLTILEQEHAAALKELGGHKASHGKAQLEQARAHGAAQAAVKVPKTLKLQQLYRDRKAAKRELQTAQTELNKHHGRGSVIGPAGTAADRALSALTAAGERVAKAKENLKGKRGPERVAATRELRAATRAQDKARGRAQATAGARPAAVAGTEAATRAAGRADAAKTALTQIEDAIKAEEGRARGVAPRQADRLGAALAGVDETASSVAATRARVRDLSEQIAVERARTAGVPHAQMERLQNALHHRDEARATAAERTGEHAEAQTHDIRTKWAAGRAHLSDAAAQGRIFEHKADAYKVKQRLNQAGHTTNIGRGLPYRFGYGEADRVHVTKRSATNPPVEWAVAKVGDHYAVVPETVKERLRVHGVVGTSKSTYAMAMRDSRAALTKAVLPFSLKWLGGQASEAGLRSAVSGAGPLDYFRTGRTINRMNEIEPGAGDRFRRRLPGGQFALTGAAREMSPPTPYAARYKGRGPEQLAAGASWLGQTPPGQLGKAALAGWNKHVLGTINGAIERTAITAMAGHAIKRDFMNDRFLGHTRAAIDDAAHGLMNTPDQVAASRMAVDMYGKYSGFSPEMRAALAYWTPFLPWYLNTARFLWNTVRDHPVKTSLAVAANSASEEWRTTNGLSAYSDNRVDRWLRGSYPLFGDRLSRVGQFTPFGAYTDIPGAVGSLALPQVQGAIFNAAGMDYLGNKMRDSGRGGEPFNPLQKATRAGYSILESQLPLVGQVGRWTGLSQRYIDRKDPTKIAPWRQRLARELPLWPLGDPIGSGGGPMPQSGFGGDAPIDVPPVDVPAIDVPAVDVDG